VKGEANLVHIVSTLGAGCGSTNLLDCGQQQADQYADDGNYNQEFN
jgi:hypothetical protein